MQSVLLLCVLYAALLTEVCAELVFLLFGQIGLNDFELLTLDRLSNSIDHRTTFQQEQRRSAWRDLSTHLVDEALVDAIMGKVPHECTHCGAYRQSEERDKEQQAERRARTHHPAHRTRSVAELCGLGFLSSNRPGEDGPISKIWINCSFADWLKWSALSGPPQP